MSGDRSDDTELSNALDNSREEWVTIFQAIGHPTLILDPSYTILAANKAVSKLLGCAEQDLQGKKCYEIFHKPEAASAPHGCPMEMMLASGIMETVEMEMEAVGGVFLVSCTPVLDTQGRLQRIIHIATDVTKHRRAEEALRKSEDRYRNFFENAIEGIYQSTPEGRYINVNPAFAHMFGYASPQEMIETVIDIKSQLYARPEDREEVTRVLAAGGIIKNLETEFNHKDGSRIWITINAQAVRDQNGNVLYYEGTTEDITERKRAEEEQRRFAERLQRVEKMEALSNLAGGVAHDMNNILGSLVGYSELLLDQIAAASPLHRYAGNILKAGQRAAAVVQDLLTLTRRGVAVADAININHVIAEYMKTPEFEKLRADNPQVILRTELEQDLLNVKGSSVHLGKTFMNLVSNAMEAIEGSGEIVIKTGNRHLDMPVHGYDDVKEGDYILLTVSDSGKGIAEADIGRIFEPFYTKKVMGRSGTGLGLTVVWGTVKDHDGYIDVQSKVGEGSVFSIYLPVTREKEMTEGERPIPPEEYRGNGEQILIVDDMGEQRELIQIMLGKLGYRVAAVGSGEEAVQYLKNNKCDLIILDMILGTGLDGLDTYRRIKEINPGQKAVIVSGFSETERVKKAQELGAGPYVRKPYIMEKIGLAVRKELDR
ncbi:MAG: PAS domain S-box protein [Smithellaceae bacterium]|nr:PAS domain S-box protein [Smithellaceae bacterium]